MARLEFDRRLSLGNILTAVTVLVAVTGGWFTLANGSEQNARDIAALNSRVASIESTVQSLMREISSERVEQTRILTELQTDVRYLRRAVDDLRPGG